MSISVLGGGAFGAALAIAIGRERPVTLWARDTTHLRQHRASSRLPGIALPDTVHVVDDLQLAAEQPNLLMAVPMQALRTILGDIDKSLDNRRLVACCKGIDLNTLQGAASTIRMTRPEAIPAVLTGPSFAIDIAKGLPTALTLACVDDAAGEDLQHALSTPALRLYRSTDVIGAELGGALKNVIAIACGVAIGAGLGESARAALLTRGFAEMTRFAETRGARAETLAGLSGLGDLALTCASETSRNFSLGLALGQGKPFDPNITVEGAATARALDKIAKDDNITLPIATAVALLVDGKRSVSETITDLLTRPLKEE